MARKRAAGRRRKGTRYHPVTVIESLGLSTLGGGSSIRGQLTADTATERYWANSVHLTASIADATAGEGPIDLWVCHSDLSTSEFDAFIANSTSFAAGNISSKEIQSRGKWAKHLGTIELDAASNVLEDGRLMKVKLGFMIETSQTIFLHAINQGGSTLTTGALAVAQGTLHGNFV